MSTPPMPSPTPSDDMPLTHEAPERQATPAAEPRDATYWAQVVSTLKVAHLPAGAVNLNVEGRRVVGPLQGFGPMWQKTYWVPLSGATITPVEVIKVWKEQFPTFWPNGNRFHRPLTGIAPGEVAVLSLKVPGGMRLSTGVLVLYADDESFTLMTPQGHVLAGWITFSAFERDSATVAQAQLLIRANDPLYEVGLRLGGHRQEDLFWQHTLQALAAYFGVSGAVQRQVVCLDPRMQWSQAGNIWQNAAVRTTFYTMTAPIRWIQRLARR